MPPKSPFRNVGASFLAINSYLRSNRDTLPVEGAGLDFWKLNKSHLPSCLVSVGGRRFCSAMGPQKYVSRPLLGNGASSTFRSTVAGKLRSRGDVKIGDAACDRLAQAKINHLLGSIGAAHRNSIFVRKLSGMDATVADVFVSAQPETECGPIFVASDDDMILFQADVPAFEVTEGEAVCHQKARASEMSCTSEIRWKYAQQAGPAGLGAVTHARATVEVVCHADL